MLASVNGCAGVLSDNVHLKLVKRGLFFFCFYTDATRSAPITND